MSEIVLIGGPPGAGKTTLARGLADHLEYKTISGDDLMVAARAVATPESHPALFLGGGESHVTYFTAGPPERLINDAAAMAEACWPVFERVIRSHRALDQSIVIDYWLFEPAKIAALEPIPTAVFLHIDPNALERREFNNPWRQDSPDPDAMHRNFMARSLWRNAYLAEQAEMYAMRILRLDGNESRDEVLAAALTELA